VQVDREGQHSGDGVTYIYPDLHTAIQGQFEDSVLVDGQQCEGTGAQGGGGLPVPTFTCKQGQHYGYEHPTARNIADHPLLRDPYESVQVEVLQSGLAQGGEGLFLRRDVRGGQVLAFYGGIKIARTAYASDYKMQLDEHTDIDIPGDYLGVHQYCATLAHKANHSFTPNCEWGQFYHPRFGAVKCILTLEDLECGQEVLINYKLSPLATAPRWYKQVWKRHQGEEVTDSDVDEDVPPPRGADCDAMETEWRQIILVPSR